MMDSHHRRDEAAANRSYFSRRVDSPTFGDLATGERHRRGIAGARRVGAVVDGGRDERQSAPRPPQCHR